MAMSVVILPACHFSSSVSWSGHVVVAENDMGERVENGAFVHSNFVVFSWETLPENYVMRISVEKSNRNDSNYFDVIYPLSQWTLTDIGRDIDFYLTFTMIPYESIFVCECNQYCDKYCECVECPYEPAIDLCAECEGCKDCCVGYDYCEGCEYCGFFCEYCQNRESVCVLIEIFVSRGLPMFQWRIYNQHGDVIETTPILDKEYWHQARVQIGDEIRIFWGIATFSPQTSHVIITSYSGIVGGAQYSFLNRFPDGLFNFIEQGGTLGLLRFYDHHLEILSEDINEPIVIIFE